MNILLTDSFYLFPFDCRPFVKHGCTTRTYRKEQLTPINKKLIKFVCKVAFLTLIIAFVYYGEKTNNDAWVKFSRRGIGGASWDFTCLNSKEVMKIATMTRWQIYCDGSGSVRGQGLRLHTINYYLFFIALVYSWVGWARELVVRLVESQD